MPQRERKEISREKDMHAKQGKESDADVIHECEREKSCGQTKRAMQEMVYKVPWSRNGREEWPDKSCLEFRLLELSFQFDSTPK